MRPRIEPIKEIKFAARHGFLTKGIWKEFFGTGTGNWRNRRWKYFRDSRIFRGSPDHLDILLPNPKHPLVREHATLVSRPPRIEELEHNTIVARSELKLRWAIRQSRVVVEAEAKRREAFFNRGYQNTDAFKFPDLTVWQKEFAVAVEIEIARKSKERYRDIFDRYKALGFELVIYVVAEREIVSLIKNIAQEFKNDFRIGFASLKSWVEDPAKAKVVLNDDTRAFKDFFMRL